MTHASTPTAVAIDAAALLGTRSGVAQFVDSLLASAGDRFAPTVYALSGRGAKQLPAIVPDLPTVGMSLPMPASLLMRVWRYWDWPKLENWMTSVSVVHGTNFVVPPTRDIARLMTVHDLTSLRFPHMCTRTTLRYPALIRRQLATGAHVHVPSQSVADDLMANFGIKDDRVHVVPTGIGPLPSPTQSLRRAPYVLATGTIEPRKDYQTLVTAFEKIASSNPEIELVVAGAFGWDADPLRKQVGTSAVAERIHLLGWVDEPTHINLLHHATVLAYPSLYEGFGLPPLRAMQAGVPVVTTNDPAVMEVSGNAALHVPAGNSDELASALTSAIADESLRQRLISDGYTQLERYDLGQFGLAMGQLYKGLSA